MDPNQEMQMPVLVFNHRSAGIASRTRYDQLSKFMEIVRSHRLREGQLAREDGRDTDLVGFNVDIGRDDGTCGIVHSFSL